MKVTGTQCSPMHPMWISCCLPGKRGSLRIWNLYPPKWLPSKSISLDSLHHCWVQWRRETLFSDHSNELALSISLNNARGTTAIHHTKKIILKSILLQFQYHSYPPLPIAPQQGYTNPVDCPNVLLCTEDEVLNWYLCLSARNDLLDLMKSQPGC